MKRLLTFCLLLIVTFSVIAVASISIGRGQPASKAVQYWHLTDCAPPCWAGITPNLTSWDNAVERIARLFGDFKRQEPSEGGRWWTKDDGHPEASASILIESNKSVLVSGVYIGGGVETMPTLGELLALFGSPTCIIDNDRSEYPVLHYERANQQMIAIGVLKISSTTRVSSIAINLTERSCQTSMAVPWRGFRSAERYLADMAKVK